MIFRLLAAILIALCAGGAESQQAYPNKPIKLISPFPPGGPSDLIARLLGEKLHAALRQPLVVDHRQGAAGNVGVEIVAKSPPDGYTLLMTIDTPLTVNPSLYPNMPFKPDELRPVTLVASSSLMFVAHPKLGVASVAEFLAKAKEREITFSSAGNGSPGHVATAMLTEKTGAGISNIFYKGNTPATLAIVSGEVEAAIIATPGLLPHVKSGRIKALAVTSAKRSPLAPEVPTTAEAGLEGVAFEVLYLLMAPSGTPPAIIATLQKEIAAALALPDVQEKLRNADLSIIGETGAAVDARLAQARERYATTIKRTGMKIE